MCGIFGYISKDSSKFDWLRFNSLGRDNDSRGGDSCGRYVSSIGVSYGVDKEKLYYKYVCKYVDPDIKSTDNVILGHCRKATVGAHTEQNAQPIVLSHKEGDKDVVDFVMVHNGTLYNYEELGEKYNLPHVDGETDSKTFAKLLNQEGPKILTEYIGAAACVFYDVKAKRETGDDIVYMFHGKSKESKYSKDTTEERPLYLYKVCTGTWYFSSIRESLAFILHKENQDSDVDCIFEVEHNMLYKFVNGLLVEKTPYDRTECLQKKPYTVAQTSSYRSGYGAWGSGYDEDDVWDAAYWRETQEQKEEKMTVEKTVEKKPDFFVSYPDLSKETVTSGIGICFAQGRYFHKDKPLNGQVKYSSYGYQVNEQIARNTSWFLNGILMKNENAYNIAKSILQYTNDILYILPFAAEKHVYIHEIGMFMHYDETLKDVVPSDGALCPFFSQYNYYFINGEVTSKGNYRTSTMLDNASERVGHFDEVKEFSENHGSYNDYISDMKFESDKDAIDIVFKLFDETKSKNCNPSSFINSAIDNISDEICVVKINLFSDAEAMNESLKEIGAKLEALRQKDESSTSEIIDLYRSTRDTFNEILEKLD